MKKLVSHLLVKYLEHRGVEHIFGLCGHTNIAVLTELEKSKIRFINVRHEQIASSAADGYARVTKKAAVVLSHVGPGLTNAATGVANAALDSIPMVVIAGDIPSHFYGKHPHQEINLHSDASQVDIYKPFVKRAWRVERPEHVPEILEKAFQLAENGNPGPVLVSVPMDIFSKEVEEEMFIRVQHHTKQLEKPSIDEQTAKKVVETLVNADQPVIYVGGGVILADAANEVRELVDHLGIPVAHSLMGKGVLPDDHPLTLGMTGFWGTTFINQKTRTADWVLGLGTRFAEADSSSWEPEYTFDIPNGTKLIHIDIDPSEIGRNYPAELGIVADLKQALQVMIRVAKELYPEGRTNEALKVEIAKERARFKEDNKQYETDNAFPMQPQRILKEVREVLPRDAYITTDVGWNKNGVGQQFPIYTPGSVLTPGGFATMGFGAPAALGAKIACPEKVVVSLVGDGGFGQNPALLATAVEENISVIWIIMNNYAFGTIAGLQKAHFGTTLGTVFQINGEHYSPDFAMVAKAYGAEGIKISAAEEFKPALKKAIDMNKPVVIDVPMINNPTPTAGHWNIMDIYSPGKKVHHVTT
ncbi:thiamine pyrophosphate-binding protein [Halalkalibacterium halodurans]|uniref:Acetohydroxyacid synthase large subunit n=1 Tax=Halalkalibacterium halodurans TaxID=86665 RepID=A0A0M0KEE1_ALKHA|nr:thiamine pyrophosphate-binding protein [Halalkalibacterium halodurans]MDY7220921.1 thiamine pyrophosphate-binding protein [Halalkalibacterium halodurans]MDY7240160.1 thiamine pyrophosphate-binding protein [Halalkalibacterium halodurans]TPE69739.1 thiamine pyrophosphate-binding protein [Halalkalibacterium halodurans]